MPSRKVLVLGRDTRAFLAVIRSLGRRDLQVHVGWCDPGGAAAQSRYVRTIHEIPPPWLDDLAWRDTLAELLARERFDLVIPCNDPSLIPLQLHRKAFEPFAGSLYLLDDDVFRVVFDKLESYELARSLGIAVPRRLRIAPSAPVESLETPFSFPVVVKPAASFTPDRLDRKHHVQWAWTPDDLARYVRALRPWGDVAVEERFRGRGVGVEVLARHGEVLVAFQHVRVHEPPGGGGSSYRRSVRLDPELGEASRRFLKALRYTGVAMIEFKVDPDTGRWVLLEINGRFWGSLPLAVAAGADFPYYLYQMLVDGRREFPQRYRTGLYCRNLVADLAWAHRTIWARQAAPGLPPHPWWSLPQEALILATLRERSDTFVLDDLRPGLVELADLARRALRPAARRLALLVPPAARWNRHARRARRALGTARVVLFVCKGNICRSPFAQHLARSLFPDHVEVLSCGYHPAAERPCPPHAVDAAASMGVDLRGHRSRVLTRSLLDAADVVFVFDEDNYRTLRRRYPGARVKIHFLGALAERPTTIRDPFHGTLAEIRASYELIARSVTAAGRFLPSTGP